MTSSTTAGCQKHKGQEGHKSHFKHDFYMIFFQFVIKGTSLRMLNCCTASARMTARFPSTLRWRFSWEGNGCTSSKSFCLRVYRSDGEVQSMAERLASLLLAVGLCSGCGFSLVGDKNSILQLREEHGVAYKRSFPGCHLIDWLLHNGEVESRRQGVELCRALLEQGIIQHGKTPHFSSRTGIKN